MPYIYKSGKKYGGAGGAEGSSSEYRKLLWTNPSPTSAFSAQTVSLDLSNYDDVEVEFMCWNTEQQEMASVTVAIGASGRMVSPLAVCAFRKFSVTSTGVAFETAQAYPYYGNWALATQNNACIPYHIYGIKYERVAPPQIDAVQEIEVAINGMGVSSGSLTAYKMGHLVLVTGMIRPSLTGTDLTLATVTGCPAVAKTWAICGGYDNATQEMYMNANSADLLFNTTGVSDLKINFCYITTA